ncbi:NAD(P)-dependent oxidoreductase [Planctomonas sp. JC2975]|uniref:NAD-dependent epimerase/dehydratase family protein n=1 Tax=Planctomonas sp. JC2975 TaxID=2729626 RepID=UPI001475DB67|nr:NAD(P)-dependent oxidoreductase [Planctomonas sp. JC2975]NNC12712.1 NAD(P)-dependent oxidoreductase [Planctomonas sp. JC2975]
MRVLIAGATGVAGIPLVARLMTAGHEVVGIVRGLAGVDRLGELGASSVTADVLDRDALLLATERVEANAVISDLTALRKAPLHHSDMRGTNVLRTVGTANLLDVARQVGADRFVTQSMVFGYGYRDLGTAPLTEDAPFGVPQHDAFDEHLVAMASNERQAFSADGIDGIAVRYGLLYGADLATIVTMLRHRTLPSARTGGRLAWVHHSDAASATVAALEHGTGGEAYNVVDDTSVTFREVLDEIAAAAGAPRPFALPDWVLRMMAPYGAAMMDGVSMLVSNEKARRELGWAPRYPSIREGVAASAAQLAAPAHR